MKITEIINSCKVDKLHWLTLARRSDDLLSIICELCRLFFGFATCQNVKDMPKPKKKPAHSQHVEVIGLIVYTQTSTNTFIKINRDTLEIIFK